MKLQCSLCTYVLSSSYLVWDTKVLYQRFIWQDTPVHNTWKSRPLILSWLISWRPLLPVRFCSVTAAAVIAELITSGILVLSGYIADLLNRQLTAHSPPNWPLPIVYVYIYIYIFLFATTFTPTHLLSPSRCKHENSQDTYCIKSYSNPLLYLHGQAQPFTVPGTST